MPEEAECEEKRKNNNRDEQNLNDAITLEHKERHGGVTSQHKATAGDAQTICSGRIRPDLERDSWQ
jgi:hypothetical protein